MISIILRFTFLCTSLFVCGVAFASGGKAPRDGGPDWSCTLSEGKTFCTSDIDIDHWLEVTAAMKSEVAQSAVSNSQFLSLEEYEASKRYFARLNSLALYLEKDSKAQNDLNSAIKERGAESICEGVFIAKGEWSRLNQKCTKNGFYLCSEEVRAYSGSIAAIKSHFSSGSEQGFKQAESCPNF